MTPQRKDGDFHIRGMDAVLLSTFFLFLGIAAPKPPLIYTNVILIVPELKTYQKIGY